MSGRAARRPGSARRIGSSSRSRHGEAASAEVTVAPVGSARRRSPARRRAEIGRTRRADPPAELLGAGELDEPVERRARAGRHRSAADSGGTDDRGDHREMRARRRRRGRPRRLDRADDRRSSATPTSGSTIVGPVFDDLPADGAEDLRGRARRAGWPRPYRRRRRPTGPRAPPGRPATSPWSGRQAGHGARAAGLLEGRGDRSPRRRRGRSRRPPRRARPGPARRPAGRRGRCSGSAQRRRSGRGPSR